MRVLVLLCLLLPPLLAPAQTVAADADWRVRVTPFDEVFPALELSQARRHATAAPTDHVLGDGTGLIAVRVHARRAGERVRVHVDAPGLGAPVRFEATLALADIDYELHPALDWDVARLQALPTPLATRLQITLERDDAVAGTREVAVSLRPLDEALYFVRDGGDSVDLSWIFAAYVDERGAVVDNILDAAEKSAIVDKFDGYASADPDRVYRQVWAVWQALTEHGIRYSSADPAIGRGPRVFSQRVRFIAQTWSDRSANCVDGSVLIASVLQRIGLRSFLVLVPGHAFVGFYTDADAQRAAYLETTLLGATVAAPPKSPSFATDVEPTRANRSSLAGFAAALAAGRAHRTRIASKLDGRHRPDYAVIDISAARAFGIHSIEAERATNDGAQSPSRRADQNRSMNAAPPSVVERDTSRVPR
ncbi:MAG: hypothetical protein P4L92_20305 [Rudaea sp.]|nr:hypothetical protein [Rudaea sp.]